MEQNTFLEEHLENIYLQEDLNDIIDKIKAPARLKSIRTAVGTKKSSVIVGILRRFLPVLKVDKIKKISVKRIKDFDRYYKTVDKNLSSNTPPDKREWISMSLTLMEVSRNELKKAGKDTKRVDRFISQVKRPFYEKYEEELFSATLLGALVGVFSLVFLYIMPTIIGSIIWTSGAAITVVIVAIFIVSFASGLLGK